jgi:hypothetical protein
VRAQEDANQALILMQSCHFVEFALKSAPKVPK